MKNTNITPPPRKTTGKSVSLLSKGFRFLQEKGVKETCRKMYYRILFQKRKKTNYFENLPSSQYEKELKLWYRYATGETLDLEHPKTFNEKIQWMKLYDSTPMKTRLADKYLVRDWVAEQIGEEHLIPLLGVWDSFDEIDFDQLPNQFVLKANHGSGWNIIVTNKNQLDKKDAKEKMDQWMKENYGLRPGLELHYMNIPPKIIAEEFIQNMDDLYDYKFFCFHGKVESIQVVSGRNSEAVETFYDINWKTLDYTSVNSPRAGILEPPKSWGEMVHIAEKLSTKFPHVRVDLYEIDGTIYFGEMTFTPLGGTGTFTKPEIAEYYGNLITLPEKSPLPTKTQ